LGFVGEPFFELVGLAIIVVAAVDWFRRRDVSVGVFLNLSHHVFASLFKKSVKSSVTYFLSGSQSLGLHGLAILALLHSAAACDGVRVGTSRDNHCCICVALLHTLVVHNVLRVVLSAIRLEFERKPLLLSE